MTTTAKVMRMRMMMMTKVVDLDDKTRELKYKSKMVSFLRQNWYLFYDKSYHLCDKSSKLRQNWLEIQN